MKRMALGILVLLVCRQNNIISRHGWTCASFAGVCTISGPGVLSPRSAVPAPLASFTMPAPSLLRFVSHTNHLTVRCR